MISIVVPTKDEVDDKNGEQTVTVLKSVRRISYLLNSNHASSLGLHPAVYFYSQEGRHKTASFLAFTDLISRLYAHNKINKFIKSRKQFEAFLLEYEYLIQQINRKYRTAQASYRHISSFFEILIEKMDGKIGSQEILESIQSNADFGYLSLQRPARQNGSAGKKFSSDDKSAIYLREVLKTAPICKICEGFIHRNSISFDHIERRSDGGSSDPLNGQLTHPYCNTGFKS